MAHQRAASGSERLPEAPRGMGVMEDYPRLLRQEFVSNTWGPLLGKAPISFGSRRGVGAGRAARQVFLWPFTGV